MRLRLQRYVIRVNLLLEQAPQAQLCLYSFTTLGVSLEPATSLGLQYGCFEIRAMRLHQTCWLDFNP